MRVPSATRVLPTRVPTRVPTSYSATVAHASSATGQRTNLEHEKSPNELRAGNTRMSGSLAQRYVVRWRARFAR